MRREMVVKEGPMLSRNSPLKVLYQTEWIVLQIGGSAMAGTREKPEVIVSQFRQLDVLQEQGATIAKAMRQIGVTIADILSMAGA